MDTAKVFKTKTGYCHVTQDKIILTRDGIIGDAAKLTMGNNIARPLIIYGIITIGFLFFSVKGFKQQDNFAGSIFLIPGILLAFSIFKSWNNSAAPIILRSSIRNVEFKKAMPGATRSYFTIYFENEKGKIKKRLILLPGSLSNGTEETKKALEIMAAEFGHK